MKTQDTKTVSKTFTMKPKFPIGSRVQRKGAKPWHSTKGSLILETGKIIAYSYASGYQVEAKNESWWYPETEIELVQEYDDFNLESFVKGAKAITRGGCIARFVKFETSSITYVVKAEVVCKDSNGSKKYIQHYSKEGYLTQGIKDNFDLVHMQSMSGYKDSSNSVEDIVAKETKHTETKEDLEKELVEAQKSIKVENKEVTDKERYDWLVHYLTADMKVDFIDIQLQQAENKQEMNAIIDKLIKSVRFS